MLYRSPETMPGPVPLRVDMQLIMIFKHDGCEKRC
jgi:hypothetical protein